MQKKKLENKNQVIVEENNLLLHIGSCKVKLKNNHAESLAKEILEKLKEIKKQDHKGQTYLFKGD